MNRRYIACLKYRRLLWETRLLSASMIFLPESPVEFIFRAATRSHMNCQEEFFEVNVSVIVLVEVSEDVVTKLFCVCRHEAGAVYVHKGLKNQSWERIRSRS